MSRIEFLIESQNFISISSEMIRNIDKRLYLSAENFATKAGIFIGVRELIRMLLELRRTNTAPTPGNFYKSCRCHGSKLLTESQFSTRESKLWITNEYEENVPNEMVRNIGKHLYFPVETFEQDPEYS